MLLPWQWGWLKARLIKPTLEKSDSLGTKSRRKRLWDYLRGRRSKHIRRDLVRNVIAWIVVMTARFKVAEHSFQEPMPNSP